MRPVLVSACLLGRQCRYDGRHNRDTALERKLAERGEVAVPVCPEEAGGLPTPRPAAWMLASSDDAAAEVVDGSARVVTHEGVDVTAEFMRGARHTLGRCNEAGIDRAYLKERSPSCGVRNTHRGGKLVPGRGVTAEMLARAGIEVIGVEGKRS